MRIGSFIIGSRALARQTRSFAARLGLAASSIVLLVMMACSGETTTEPGEGGGQNPAPAPAISELLPTTVVAGSPALTLTVRGQGFVARSRIRIGDADRQTQFVSATELRTTLTAQDLATAGVMPVTVRTAGPGGGTAQARQLTIRQADSPAQTPVLSELSPAQITAGWPAAFTLVVKGEHFTTASRVLWNGTPRETHYISASELRSSVEPADVAVPADITISVETPATGESPGRVFPVRLRTPARVDVTSSVGSWLWLGDTMTLSAVARDLAGGEIPHWTFEWSSVHDHIARVNETGRVTGVAKGRTQVRATAGEVTGTAQVAVYEAPEFDLVYDIGTNDERYLVRWTPGSTSQPVLITSAGISFDPSPSPDGSRVAFTGIVGDDRDIYTIGRNGTGLERLTTGTGADDEAAWSPDGSRIAFRSTRSGASEVWVMNADGSDPRKLTGPDDGWILNEESFDPAWSPGSQYIAYAKREANDADIWIMNADGSGKRRLTSGEAQDTDPVWSHDGTTITFRRSEGAQVYFVTVTAAEGMPVYTGVQVTYGRAPSMSPDGRWMAYTQTGAEPNNPLMVVPVDGSDGPRIVRTSAIGGGGNPQWMRR